MNFSLPQITLATKGEEADTLLLATSDHDSFAFSGFSPGERDRMLGLITGVCVCACVCVVCVCVCVCVCSVRADALFGFAPGVRDRMLGPHHRCVWTYISVTGYLIG